MTHPPAHPLNTPFSPPQRPAPSLRSPTHRISLVTFAAFVTGGTHFSLQRKQDEG